MAARDPHRVGATLEDVELFFTVTTGRSGTGYLSSVAALLHDVDARHEPRPNFAARMRTVQDGRFSGLAKAWILEQKIPAIMDTTKPAYLESSHLFCKGFLEPWLEVGPVPNLIIWRRERRKIAKSLLKIGSIPGRTPEGIHYFLAPTDPGVVPVQEPQSLNDYQICYWYVLEIERRQLLYANLIREHGGRVFESGIDQLNTEAGFIELTQFLRHRDPDPLELRSFNRMVDQPVNTKSHKKSRVAREVPSNLDDLEAEVDERVQSASR